MNRETKITPDAVKAGRDELIASSGEDLVSAYETKTPIAPLREKLPNMTVTDAYRIQQAQVPYLTSKWGEIVGHKVGLTSLAMQKQLGVDSPDFGFFTKGQFFSDGAQIAADRFISPKVEPEFAFLLKDDLAGESISVEQVASVIESIHPAVEIIDSRIANWDITLPDTIADNASCGAVVIGSSILPVSPQELNDVSCALVLDGECQAEGHGRDVLGNPLAAVAWLAETLHKQGQKLSKGQWILPGSFTAAAVVTAGNTIAADFGELGQLEFSFV